MNTHGGPRPIDSTGLKRLHRDWRRRTHANVALLLDDVQSPFNVGAILRTAAAYSVEHIWCCGRTAAPVGAKTDKLALGSQKYLQFTIAERVLDAIAEAKDAGYTVVGIELADGALPIGDVDLGGDVCLVIGNEDHGVHREALAACDHLAYIPQTGKIGSLNVATATAIAIYEARRQAWLDTELS